MGSTFRMWENLFYRHMGSKRAERSTFEQSAFMHCWVDVVGWLRVLDLPNWCFFHISGDELLILKFHNKFCMKIVKALSFIYVPFLLVYSR